VEQPHPYPEPGARDLAGAVQLVQFLFKTRESRN